MTLKQLREQVMMVANALDSMFSKGDAIAIDMPMIVTVVVIYSAIVLAGFLVVSIADSFAAQEIAVHLRVSNAKAIYTAMPKVKHFHNPLKSAHASYDANENSLGEPIIVDFDEYNSTIGASQGLLAGYLGTLAVDCNLFPIRFDRWLGPKGVPKKYKEDCFEIILKPRFYFRTTEANVYRYCTSNMAKKWASHRLNTYDEFNDPAKSTNEILSNDPAKSTTLNSLVFLPNIAKKSKF